MSPLKSPHQAKALGPAARALAVLAIAAALALCALAGCSTPATTDKPAVTLSLWHVYGSQTQSPLNDLVAEFNATVGAQEGIVVNVTSVTDSDSIDEAPAAAANNEPGSPALPKLFTAYPRVAETVGADRLLAWDDYLTAEELDRYVDGYLAEGYLDGRLLMLPIAKSTEMLFVNNTLFERFAAAEGIEAEDLTSFETLLPLCERYAAGQNEGALFQMSDYYHYFLAAAAAQGVDFVRDGALDVDGAWFEEAWMPLARAGISGGMLVGDGYASDRWKTGEVLCHVGSSANIMYLRDYVTYADGTTEDIETAVYPYPAFDEDSLAVVSRGGGLFAIDDGDERANAAAACFARWITLQEANLRFTTAAGYLPVTEQAFDQLLGESDLSLADKYHLLYEAAADEYARYALCTAPVFEGSADVQDDFERFVKEALVEAREGYREDLEAGLDPEEALQRGAMDSLEFLRRMF